MSVLTLFRDIDQSFELVDFFSVYTPFRKSERDSGISLDKIMEGLVIDESEEADNNFVDNIKNKLFGGADLVAFNIQRGRDHGLPSYVTFRDECGVSGGQTTTWEDLERGDANNPPNINKRVRTSYLLLFLQNFRDIDACPL